MLCFVDRSFRHENLDAFGRFSTRFRYEQEGEQPEATAHRGVHEE